MSDIELVIKIPEEVYKKAKETHDVMCDSVWLGIKYGTPLPKGHGDLIDADANIKDLSKRVENIEKQMKEDKERKIIEKLKAELDYAKFCCALDLVT